MVKRRERPIARRSLGRGRGRAPALLVCAEPPRRRVRKLDRLVPLFVWCIFRRAQGQAARVGRGPRARRRRRGRRRRRDPGGQRVGRDGEREAQAAEEARARGRAACCRARRDERGGDDGCGDQRELEGQWRRGWASGDGGSRWGDSGKQRRRERWDEPGASLRARLRPDPKTDSHEASRRRACLLARR